MPRRGVQPSRQQQAFEMLLDQQYAADPLSTSAGVSSSRGKGGRQLKKTNRVVTDKRVSERLPGFVLRDSLHSEPPSQQPSARIEQLYSMFGALLDRSTIDQVLKCQHSVEAAIDELLSMSEHKRSEAEVGSSSRHLTQPSGQSAGSSYWSWLPEECKELVLKHLDSKDLAKAARTCKELAEHIRAVRAGLGVLKIPPGLSSAAVRGMVAAYTGATTVNLARCAGQLRHTVDFANMFAALSRGAAARLQGQPLTRLDLKGCVALRTDDVASLCDYFDSLRGLSLRACEDVDDAAVILLSKYTAAKHDLIPDFSKMDVASNSPADSLQHTPGSLNKTAALVTPTFRNVSLQRSMLGSNLVGLRKAEAPSNPNQHLLPLLDAEAAVLTQGSSSSEPGLRQHQPSHQGSHEGLEFLSLAGCSKVTDKGLTAVLKGSPAARSLTSLDVSRCIGLSESALDLPPKGVLHQLTASFCHGITSVTIQLPPAASLQSVSLTGCRKLKQVVISAPQLADLSVDDCAQLHSLQLQCPSLTVLGASKCNSLTGFLPALDCPCLHQLNLFGCRQLHSEDIEEALDALPELVKLNVNGCISLTRLVLMTCTKLEWLDCSGCALLHHVQAFSSALSHVRAIACQRLVEVSLNSAKLSNLDLLNCGELRSLSCPELDQALSQQLVSPGPSAPPRRRPKDCLARRVNVDGCDKLPDAVATVLL